MLTNRFLYPTTLAQLRDEMDRLFSRPFFPGDGGRETGFPPLNVWESPSGYVAEAELPGLAMDDLEILVSGDELTIKGKRPEPAAEGLTWHRRERGTGSFTRVVHLPTEIDAEKVSAELKNGVLAISLPKAAEHQPRRIEVKAG